MRPVPATDDAQALVDMALAAAREAVHDASESEWLDEDDVEHTRQVALAVLRSILSNEGPDAWALLEATNQEEQYDR